MAGSRPTLRDVARLAEVSVTQASRALNGHGDVSEGTRRSVAAAAEQLGYRPNMQARALKMPSMRANAIGIVLPATTLSFSYPFLGSLVAGFIQVANECQFEVDISTVSDESLELLTYKRAIDQRRVDGFLLLRTRVEDDRVGFLAEHNIPYATFGRIPSLEAAPSVDDADDCMLPLVRHLADLGHTRIACVAEPDRFARSHLRLRSFVASMEECGLAVDDGLIAIGDFELRSGYAAAEKLLAEKDRPTAIVGLNDLLALGVLGAAFDLGLSVPRDLSVTGFDDVHLAALARPPLTTLRVDAERIGAELATGLLAFIDNGTIAAPSLHHPSLVERDSTGPAPA